MKLGIDVSVHQSTIDWQQVKNSGIDFAILRTGYGSPSIDQIDKRFYDNLEGANSVGIPLGAYHYGYATSVAEAQNEAQFCLDILNGTDMPYCVWYDVEERCMFNCGVQGLTDIINAFCRVIENAGYKTGVYMSCSYAQNNVDMSHIPYFKWIAQYNPTLNYDGADMWQYEDTGNVAGICTNVDMNYCYTDFGVNPIEDKKTEWVWYDTDQKWAYKRNGEWVYNEWIWDNENNSWYYVDAGGWMIKNAWFFDEKENSWYYLKDNGKMARNEWIWDDKTSGWYYLKDDGKMAKNENITTDGKTYYVDNNGKYTE